MTYCSDLREWYEGFGHKAVDCKQLDYGCVCLFLSRYNKYFYAYTYTHPEKGSLGRRTFYPPISSYEKSIIDSYFTESDKEKFYEFYNRTYGITTRPRVEEAKPPTKPYVTVTITNTSSYPVEIMVGTGKTVINAGATHSIGMERDTTITILTKNHIFKETNSKTAKADSRSLTIIYYVPVKPEEKARESLAKEETKKPKVGLSLWDLILYFLNRLVG